MCTVLSGLLVFLAAAVCGAHMDDPRLSMATPSAAQQEKTGPDEKAKPQAKEDRKAKKPGAETSSEPAPQESVVKENAGDKLKAIVERATRHLGEAEERLNKNDAGRTTQQVQNDIVRDLDELIEQFKRSDEQQKQQQNESKGGSSNSRGQRSQQDQATQGKGSANSQQRTISRQASQPKQAQSNARRSATTLKDEMSKIADLYKDVWGHLPETLRQEMDQYSRERFMPKYDELLKQYYATIAEKGKRKGD
jgi:hypothetical protein